MKRGPFLPLLVVVAISMLVHSPLLAAGLSEVEPIHHDDDATASDVVAPRRKRWREFGPPYAPKSANIVPGARQMALGRDTYDGTPSKLPIFLFTYKNFRRGSQGQRNVLNVVNRHGHTVPMMVPDPLYMTGPEGHCESSSDAETVVVSSTHEMSSYEVRHTPCVPLCPGTCMLNTVPRPRRRRRRGAATGG